jgi:hypothetical protein
MALSEKASARAITIASRREMVQIIRLASGRALSFELINPSLSSLFHLLQPEAVVYNEAAGSF